MQVIAITHLPQIASRGSPTCWYIKLWKAGVPEPRSGTLMDQDRILEIAKMLGWRKAHRGHAGNRPPNLLFIQSEIKNKRYVKPIAEREERFNFGALDENPLPGKWAEKAYEHSGAHLVLTNAPIALRKGDIFRLGERLRRSHLGRHHSGGRDRGTCSRRA
jgi:hypothetical protein